MNTNEITCELCGGTNFYIQDGNYYCTECQQLSQDIREQIFDIPEETTATRSTSTKRIRKEKKQEDQLTSWECYNYILLGLVNELIELGANSNLKRTIHILWFKYLKKLEVISDKPNTLPRLCAVNNQKDAEILYGRAKRKRRSSRTPSPSSVSGTSTTDASILRKEKAKQRRSMVLAEYDELSNTMQSEDISLHNQSLTSLKSGSDSSKTKEDKYLRYNSGSKKQLLSIMSKTHLRNHCRDIDSLLDCHRKIPHRLLSHKFIHSYEVLSRNKIYALIYLGLLINKDKIQLGDMLRFIREGHLSFSRVDHFFPEEFDKSLLNIKYWNYGNKFLCHFRVREVAANIAKNLKITKYIPRQDLVQLCQRYCTELNLPDEVCGYTLNLLSKALPRMNFSENSSIIPNYEGRVMSFIIFFLKLTLGFDEVTEERFSSYAEDVNASNISRSKMFVWKDWADHINYRKLVLSQHHFPTQYLFNRENIEIPTNFIDFANAQNLKHEIDEKVTREVEVLQRILEKLKSNQPSSKPPLQFIPTLTPFRDYVKILLDSTIPQENNYLLNVLNFNFKDYSFNFLINPIFYLEQLNNIGKVGIKHRGANHNLKIVKIPNPKVDREHWRKVAKKTLTVRICKKGAVASDKEANTEHLKKCDNLLKNIVEKNDSKEIIKNFQQRNMKLYESNLKRLLAAHKRERIYSQAQLEPSQNVESEVISQRQSSSQSQEETVFSQQYSFLNNSSPNTSQNSSQTENGYYMHYNPYDRYCLKSVSNITKGEFREFIIKLPNSFRLTLKECSRITEQTSWELFNEFIDVEIYLSYVAEFMDRDKKRHKIVNNDLKRFIRKAKKNW